MARRSPVQSGRNQKLVALLLLASLLTACGFQLRGSGRPSSSELVGSVYIYDPEKVSVYVPLRNALTAQQVRFVPHREQADTVVVLSNEKTTRRVASVSASGRVSEYELLHAIDLGVLRSTGQERLGAGEIAALLDKLNPQTVSVIRDYTYDETDVLAKDDEERILRSEMEAELIRHLSLRIFAGVL